MRDGRPPRRRRSRPRADAVRSARSRTAADRSRHERHCSVHGGAVAPDHRVALTQQPVVVERVDVRDAEHAGLGQRRRAHTLHDVAVHHVRAGTPAGRVARAAASVGPDHIGEVEPRPTVRRAGTRKSDSGYGRGATVATTSVALDAEGHDADRVAGGPQPPGECRRVLLGAARAPRAARGSRPSGRASGGRRLLVPVVPGEHSIACVSPCASACSPTPSTCRAASAATSARSSPPAPRRDDVRLTVLAPASGVPDGATADGARTRRRRRPTPFGPALARTLGPVPVRHGLRARPDAEVVIGTKHLVPNTRRPTLLVVHDVLTITRAHENALAKRLLLPAQYRSSLTRASRLVAVERGHSDPARRAGPRVGAQVRRGPERHEPASARGRAGPDPVPGGPALRARRGRPLPAQEPRPAHAPLGRSRPAGAHPRGRGTRRRRRRPGPGRAVGPRAGRPRGLDPRRRRRAPPVVLRAGPGRAVPDATKRGSGSRCSRR